MFLGIYRFEGDVARLRESYDRMLEQIPHSGLHLHLCVSDSEGLLVYDTCPSKEIFLSFAASPEFKKVIASVGLPAPEVTPVGDIHAAYVAGHQVY